MRLITEYVFPISSMTGCTSGLGYAFTPLTHNIPQGFCEFVLLKVFVNYVAQSSGLFCNAVRLSQLIRV